MGMSMTKPQWTCKVCKGRFETMSEHQYHECVPKPFERDPKKPAAPVHKRTQP